MVCLITAAIGLVIGVVVTLLMVNRDACPHYGVDD